MEYSFSRTSYSQLEIVSLPDHHAFNRKTNKSELCRRLKISSSTMAKMTNEEMVSMSVLEKICAELDCNIGDIVEFTRLEEVKKSIDKV